MLVVYAIIIANILFSYKGFEDRAFFERHKFHIDGILVRKEYSRLITSAFLHADYAHLIFNMLTFYIFAEIADIFMSPTELLVVYFGSLLGGDLLALYFHRNHGDYSSIGASGAVSGVVYSVIILHPNIIIYFFLPGWLFGIIYMLYTMFGMKRQKGRIAHDAHLGGAIAGLVITVCYFIGKYDINYWILAAMLIPTSVFLYLVAYHPEWMLGGKIDWSNNPIAKRKHNNATRAPKRDPITRDAELNQLLDKVNRVGYQNLTEAEKHRLDQLS